MIVQTENPLLIGEQIDNFRRGWAINRVAACKAHYYHLLEPGQAVTTCGHRIETYLLYGAGNFPHCRNCQRSADKRGLE